MMDVSAPHQARAGATGDRFGEDTGMRQSDLLFGRHFFMI
jgi:hypothetical protein